MPKLELSKVHDAYAAVGECPLCILMDGAERNYLVSLQGARVMEPSVRVRTNRTGFCPEHTRKLYKGENKLGLALVTHTHLREQLAGLLSTLRGMAEAAKDGRKGKDRLEGALHDLEDLRRRCYLCELLEADLDHYLFTVLYLWRKDPEFKATLAGSRGFCLSHFASLVSVAMKTLRPEELAGLVEAVVPLMTNSLERLERDLMAFTELFQAGNRDLGGEEQRLALAHALQKLAGSVMKLD